tara:strand:- start:2933 stop:3589 length:657 start_codon:yes stop_codon:yes gene_type:complete
MHATRPPVSAAAAGFIACLHCSALIPTSALAPHGTRCPRCAARVHVRLPHSLQRTWALVLCAALCYVPANLLPILSVTRFGSGDPDTIFSGVVHLFAAGQWPIAVLVFVASVFVPLLKIVVIIGLLISIETGSRAWLRERTALFHFIDFLGRWSMIDIFMISILVAIVQLGSIATIEAGLGAAYFGAVVICTMFAAITFDPRLLWDAADARDPANGCA